MPSRILAFSSAAVLLVSTVTAGGPAEAAVVKAGEPVCTFYRSLQFGDYSSGGQPENYEGAGINFTNDPPTPTPCNIYGDGNSSSAWAMWVGADNVHQMQGGIFYATSVSTSKTGCKYSVWGQYNMDRQQDVFGLGACVNPGDAHHTYVESRLISSGWEGRIVADGTVLYSTRTGGNNFSPFDYIQQPSEVEYAEETHYILTRALGTNGSRTHFGHLQVENRDTNVWEDVCGHAYLHAANTGGGASQYFADSFPTCDSFDAWDTRG